MGNLFTDLMKESVVETKVAVKPIVEVKPVVEAVTTVTAPTKCSSCGKAFKPGEKYRLGVGEDGKIKDFLHMTCKPKSDSVKESVVVEEVAKNKRGKLERRTRFHAVGAKDTTIVKHDIHGLTGTRLAKAQRTAKRNNMNPLTRKKQSMGRSKRRAAGESNTQLNVQQTARLFERLQEFQAPVRVVEALRNQEYDRVAAFFSAVLD